MIFCEVELCIYNEDFYCIQKDIEIELSGKCYQCMIVPTSEESLKLISKEVLDLIKKDYLKNEKELWDERLLKK